MSWHRARLTCLGLGRAKLHRASREGGACVRLFRDRALARSALCGRSFRRPPSPIALERGGGCCIPALRHCRAAPAGCVCARSYVCRSRACRGVPLVTQHGIRCAAAQRSPLTHRAGRCCLLVRPSAGTPCLAVRIARRTSRVARCRHGWGYVVSSRIGRLHPAGCGRCLHPSTRSLRRVLRIRALSEWHGVRVPACSKFRGPPNSQSHERAITCWRAHPNRELPGES